MGMLLQVSAITDIFQPTFAKAATNEIYATGSGSAADVLYKENIQGTPNDTVATVPSDNSDKYVYGKDFAISTGTISKVEIAAKYKVSATFTDDKFRLSYKISGGIGATDYQEISNNTDFVTKYLDVTPDRAWTWTDITNLQVHATNNVLGASPDGSNLLVDALWIRVTTSQTTAPCVVINEIMWMGSNSSIDDEWIELKSHTNSVVDISGWRITGAATGGTDLIIPAGKSIPANGYFLIANYNKDNANSKLNVTPDWVTTDIDLPNTALQLILKDSSLNVLDRADDGVGVPFAGDNTNKYSMERNDDYGDGTIISNWHTATTSHGWDVGATEKGTPSYLNGSIEETVKPTSLINSLGDYYNLSTWPELINGTASDDTGIIKVELKIKRSDGKYWNGSTWIDLETWNLTTGTTSWSYGFNKVNLTDGKTYNLYSKATDSSGNSNVQSSYGTESFTYDNTSPTGSVKINSGAGVTNSQNVTLTLTASADTEKMLVSNSSDFSTTTAPTWETYAASKNWGLTLDKGTKTVYVKFKDQAGNISPIYSASVYYNQSASSVSSQLIVLGTNAVTYSNVVITLNAKTDATLTYAKYSTNPETQTAFSVFGGYFDISVNDTSKLHFPVNVKFYYTQADLDAAGITNENQILGLYYYDSSSAVWKLYSDTGVNTANISLNGNNYTGYVWANVDHFTPMVIGADTTAPSEPYNFKGATGDSEIKLTWDKVSDADHYDIRYRKATNNDVAVSYSDIYIITNTETTIAGLENDTEYEFNVRAVDKANNKSQWRIIVDTPQKTTLTTEKTKTTASQTSFVAQAYAATPSPTEQQQVINPSSGTEIETEGAVKSEEDQANTAESTRTAVTLGIIIIAIGAALGGYYGYQWWIGKTEEEEALPKPKKKDYTGKDKEKSKQTRRW